MFLIGILSSPIPYILVSFVYLLGLSYGVFSSNKKATHNETPHSNIINYEELTPTIHKVTEDANYFSFCKSTSNYTSVAYADFLKMFFKSYITFNFIVEKKIHYNYLRHPYLSNRPPPNYSLN